MLFGSLKTTIDAFVEEYTTEKMPPPWLTYTIQNRPGSGNMHLVQKVFEGLQAEESRDVLLFRLRDQADRQRQEEL
jgi:hypothetical protein